MAAPHSCMEFAGNARRASPVGSTAAWADREVYGHPPFGNWRATSFSRHWLQARETVGIGPFYARASRLSKFSVLALARKVPGKGRLG